MLRPYIIRVGKVGYSACHLQYAVVGTGGERQPLHGYSEHLYALLVGFGILMNHPLGHLCVAMDRLVCLETLFLYPSGGDYSLAYRRAGFARLHIGERSFNGTALISQWMSIRSEKMWSADFTYFLHCFIVIFRITFPTMQYDCLFDSYKYQYKTFV